MELQVPCKALHDGTDPAVNVFDRKGDKNSKMKEDKNGKNDIKQIASVVVIGILMVSAMCACTQQDLEDMASGTGDGYGSIVWGDKTYVPYGALVSYGERGKQIGIVDGDKDDRVYELKGYSADEWIVNAFPHDGGMLLKEIEVTDIPDGWQSEYEWNQ